MTFREHFSDIKCDLWTHLANSKKPIVLYGMGDGADKIYDQLESRNIMVSGVFASEGFVPKNDKFFRGLKILSYNTAKETFKDMIVLVCFGTKLDEVIENINKIQDEQELYAPDVPVFGERILDTKYFNDNFTRFQTVYNLLCDDISKNAFVNSIKFRLTGKIKYLSGCETTIDESYKTIISKKEIKNYIDIGAYNGDTIRELVSQLNISPKISAFEPDKRNFKKLNEFCVSSNYDITPYNFAAWNKTEEITFYSRSGRNSASTTSHKGEKTININAVAVDEICESADYIKIDAEGSDKNAILGLQNLIKKDAPLLNIAAYHRTEDYFDIPETVLSINSNYKIYFRHFKHIPCWDTNFYFI